LFGIPLSSGTVAGLTARAAGRLGAFLERYGHSVTGSVARYDPMAEFVAGRLAR
jgi:hypothetical protein